MSTWISIGSPPLMAVFGETLPLCHDLFRPCLSAELCSKSQTKRQEETLAMCFPSVQEGQTWWGMDEEGRLFHFVQRQRWGTFEDLRPDIKRNLSGASQTLVHAGGALHCGILQDCWVRCHLYISNTCRWERGINLGIHHWCNSQKPNFSSPMIIYALQRIM